MNAIITSRLITKPAEKETCFPIITMFSVAHKRTMVVPFEHLVYHWAGKLCATYTGGRWDFYALSNGGRYMAFRSSEPVLVEWPYNYFSKEMTGNAFGLTATLYALSHAPDAFTAAAEDYSKLYEYITFHPEADLIFAAID